MKSFKQFITEIYTDNAVSVESKFKKMDNNHIAKNYDLHHTSKMGEYDVSHATHKKDKTHALTFIHHNGEHVGTISGTTHSDGKKGFTVHKSSIAKEHQGKSLMTKTYAHLATQHNHEIHSDTVQSHAGHNIWKKLHQTPGVKVTAHMKNNKISEPAFHNLHHDYSKSEYNKNVGNIKHYVVTKK